MKNKGFTLIELLAVIVILAIVAVIAIPIILNIIEEAREESYKRSVEMYANAIKNSLVTVGFEQMELEPGTYSSETFPLTLHYDGDVVCDTIQINADGTIGLADCKVDGEKVDYEYGKLATCRIKRQNSNKYTIGDVVTCKLTESTDKFYVIQNTTKDSKTIELLPEKNIHVKDFRQSDSAGKTDFATQKYDEYGTVVYYNSLTPIINGYVSYLNKSNLGATGAIINGDQLERLGCFASNNVMGYYCNGTSGIEGDVVGAAPSWVYTPAYWGDFVSENARWYVTSFVDYTFIGNTSSGVRPVITVNTSEVG